MIAVPLAEAIPHLAGLAMLLLGLVLPTRRRGGAAAARLLAWQGASLALAAASVAWSGAAADPSLWFLAAGALAGRALLLPALLGLAAGKAGGEPPRRTAGGGGAALLLGGGAAVLAIAAVVPAGAGLVASSGARQGIALALAVLLAGLLAMLPRRGVLSGLVGLLAAENGALLGLVHLGAASPPGAAALAVLSPGLAACAVLAARLGGGGGPALFLRSLLRKPRR